MCISALTASALAAGGGLVASKVLAPKAPKIATVDPAAEKAAADTAAATAANSKLATRNRSRAASSLSVNTAASNVPALGGKTTLGQ